VYVTVFEFCLFGITQGLNVTGKEQVNTRHRVIEVEFNGIQPHPCYHACETVSVLILQGNHISDFEQSVGDCTILFEG
jgi:hypothetical protein